MEINCLSNKINALIQYKVLRGHRKASANSAKESKENLSKEVIFKLNIEVYQVGMKKKGHFW